MMKKHISMAVAATVAVAAFGTSCKKEKEDQTPTLVALAVAADNAASKTSGTIQFSISAGTIPVDCSTTGLTVNGHTGVSLQDARFYVSNVKLVKADGNTVAVTLTDTSSQSASTGVALLDFEDKTGSCTGDATTNTALSVTFPATNMGTVVGVEFDLGIPDATNRLYYGKASDAPAPFYNSTMYWAWASAYKFARLQVVDGSASAAVLHIGSTGTGTDTSMACDDVTAMTATNTNVATSGGTPNACKFMNRATIRVIAPSFSLESNKVNLDLAAVFNGSSIGWGATNCMSFRLIDGNPRPACVEPFTNLGINPLNGGSIGAQTSFSIR